MHVVVAEDSAILRDGLVALLGRHEHTVTAVGDGDALLAEVHRQVTMGTPPQVAVVDVRMPPTFTDEGLRAALALRERHPDVGVLLFSQYVETRYAAQLFGGNARGAGYLLKDRVADVGDFLDALERIADGQTVLDPEVVTQLMGEGGGRSGVDRLTTREREVLELMAEGRSNGAIAKELFLSYGAVEKNVTAIFDKLGLAPDSADHRRVLAVLHYLRG